MSELTPQHVLTDLFGSDDFPAVVLDTEHAADLVVQRLRDAGFEIVPTDRGSTTGAMRLSAAPEETPCRLTQLLMR